MNMFQTEWIRAVGIEYPVIQAGMAGGPTTPQLVAAVSNAGGLGTLGAGYMTPQQIRKAIAEIRSLTDKPFAVNLFVPEPYHVNAADVEQMNAKLDEYRDVLSLPLSPPLATVQESFAEQLDVVLSERISVSSFTFGIPDEAVLQRLQSAGVYTIGTATTVQEAILLERAGVDAIVAQGSEAGGHRGTFAHSPDTALIGTMALVPQMVDHVRCPVIAAGGIMDGRGLAAAIVLGAAGVQMGTAFLTCPESGAHPVHKEAVASAQEDATAVTTAYSGKSARGIHTVFMEEMDRYQGTIPPYPVQNALTRDIRRAAAEQNRPQYMSLWAGQGLRLTRSRTAAEVVAETVTEAMRALQRFSSH